MRIIFVIDSLTNAGTEKSLLDIISNFSSNTKASIVYLHPPHTLKNQFEIAGIETICLNESRNKSYWFNVKELRKIIKTTKPDYVVSSLFKSNIVSRIVCYLSNTKLIGTFVSDNYSSIRKSNLNIKQKIGLFFIKQIDLLTAKIPVAFISNSNSVKLSNCKELCIAKSKVTVIYRGRNSDLITAWKKPINTNNFTFIIVARVLKTKGFKELIEAFSVVKKEYSNIDLQIYGDGNYIDKAKQNCHNLVLANAINFNGNKADAWQYFNDSNCFIFPSWYEGLSGALVEASISGIPIIASDIKMNVEVVKGFKNTITHQVKDANSIAKCMIQMIENYNEYVSYSNITRKIAIEKFEIKHISKKYEDFFQHQIQKH